MAVLVAVAISAVELDLILAAEAIWPAVVVARDTFILE
jgi:hypothetical protein